MQKERTSDDSRQEQSTQSTQAEDFVEVLDSSQDKEDTSLLGVAAAVDSAPSWTPFGPAATQTPDTPLISETRSLLHSSEKKAGHSKSRNRKQKDVQTKESSRSQRRSHAEPQMDSCHLDAYCDECSAFACCALQYVRGFAPTTTKTFRCPNGCLHQHPWAVTDPFRDWRVQRIKAFYS